MATRRSCQLEVPTLMVSLSHEAPTSVQFAFRLVTINPPDLGDLLRTISPLLSVPGFPKCHYRLWTGLRPTRGSRFQPIPIGLLGRHPIRPSRAIPTAIQRGQDPGPTHPYKPDSVLGGDFDLGYRLRTGVPSVFPRSLMSHSRDPPICIAGYKG